MPKELSHWIFAEAVAEHIKSADIKKAIKTFKAYYYLGSVAYDSPFYTYLVRNAKTLTQAGLRIHGVFGGDTLEIQRAFFRSYQNTGSKIPLQGISFISGTLTHLCADINFHPLVNYFSGRYADSEKKSRLLSQRRHRQFESLLDFYFCTKRNDSAFHVTSRRSCKRVGALHQFLAAMEREQDQVIDILNRFYFGKSQDKTTGVWELVRRHSQLQRLFSNGTVGSLVRWLGAIAGGGLRVISATFYPVAILKNVARNPDAALALFSRRIQYRHPNSGVKLSHSVDELAKKTVDDAAALIDSFGGDYQERDLFSGIKGKSLEYGCDADEFPTPKHFDLSKPVPALCRDGL